MLPEPRSCFADLAGPRPEARNKLHKLTGIVMIVFCAVLSGIEDWLDMPWAVRKPLLKRSSAEADYVLAPKTTLRNCLWLDTEGEQGQWLRHET
jgi:hypothetical protein